MERFKFSNKLWSLHCCLDAGKQLRVRIVLMSLSMLGWGSQNQLMMGNIRLLMFNTLLKQWLGFLYVNMNYGVKSSTVKYALHFCAGHVLEVLSILLSVCLSTNQSAIHPSIYLSPIYPWAQQTKIIYCTVNILSGILNVAQHGCMMTQIDVWWHKIDVWWHMMDVWWHRTDGWSHRMDVWCKNTVLY